MLFIHLIIDSKDMSNRDSAWEGVNIMFLRNKEIATCFLNKHENGIVLKRYFQWKWKHRFPVQHVGILEVSTPS